MKTPQTPKAMTTIKIRLPQETIEALALAYPGIPLATAIRTFILTHKQEQAPEEPNQGKP